MTQHFRRGNHYASKLRPDQIIEMRQRYAEGWTQGALVKEYDVSLSTVARCVRGEIWRHLPQPRSEEELTTGAAKSQAAFLRMMAADPQLAAVVQSSAEPAPANAAADPKPAPAGDVDIAAEIQRRYGFKVSIPPGKG